MKFVIYLPEMPPTVNTAFATYRGRRVLSKSQREFRRVVSGIVKTRIPEKWKYVDVEIILTPARRMRFDVDNRIKPTLDALTTCGFWKDDSQVASVHVYCTQPSEGGGAIIIVKQAMEKYQDFRKIAPLLDNSIILK